MRHKNKYRLDRKAEEASRKIALEVIVTYDIDTDAIKSTVFLRSDIIDDRAKNSDELMLRLGRQLENAVRTVMPPYKEEMELLERLAKLGGNIGVHDEECDCAPVS